MKLMKKREVAAIFGISDRTLPNWIDREEFSQFFSDYARGNDKFRRQFTEQDVLVLNTIHSGRNQGKSWEEISALLHSGYRETELPPGALFIESTAPIAQYGKIIAMRAELDVALSEVERLENELNRERNESKEIRTRKEEEIAKLNREIGRLEGIIEMLERRQDE